MMQPRETRVTTWGSSEPRKRKPLAEILAAAIESGEWDGTPAEITEEDREWLDMLSVGEEIIW